PVQRKAHHIRLGRCAGAALGDHGWTWRGDREAPSERAPKLVLTGRRTEAPQPLATAPGSGIRLALVTLLGRPSGAGTLDRGPRGRNLVSILAEEVIRS